MIKIKKCPFCGGEAGIVFNYSKLELYFVSAECELCRARARTYTTKEDPNIKGYENDAVIKALNAWNTRQEEKEAIWADP